MKKFTLGEIKKTILNVKKDLGYNNNVTVKFITINEEYTDVLIVIKDMSYDVVRINYVGIFTIESLNDWIYFKIKNGINNLFQDYIYKR